VVVVTSAESNFLISTTPTATRTSLTLPQASPQPTIAPSPPSKLEKREVPPHTLGIPKTWKLGVEQTVSLTIYDWTFKRRDITAILYMKQCSCTRRPRFQRRCKEKRVFSSEKVESNPGKHHFLTKRRSCSNESALLKARFVPRGN
jgi:hypothetical protein